VRRFSTLTTRSWSIPRQSPASPSSRRASPAALFLRHALPSRPIHESGHLRLLTATLRSRRRWRAGATTRSRCPACRQRAPPSGGSTPARRDTSHARSPQPAPVGAERLVALHSVPGVRHVFGELAGGGTIGR
jgi:hypothetical protein